MATTRDPDVLTYLDRGVAVVVLFAWFAVFYAVADLLLRRRDV
jgi:hypothetical protein